MSLRGNRLPEVESIRPSRVQSSKSGEPLDLPCHASQHCPGVSDEPHFRGLEPDHGWLRRLDAVRTALRTEHKPRGRRGQNALRRRQAPDHREARSRRGPSGFASLATVRADPGCSATLRSRIRTARSSFFSVFLAKRAARSSAISGSAAGRCSERAASEYCASDVANAADRRVVATARPPAMAAPPSFITQRHDRIDLRCASRRQVAGQHCDHDQHHRHDGEDRRIGRADLE
jgi:hypothetical protein